MDLGEEGHEWILAAYSVARGTHEVKPLAIVDIALGLPASSQYLDRDLLQTLRRPRDAREWAQMGTNQASRPVWIASRPSSRR
jgi:hypothetical protein